MGEAIEEYVPLRIDVAVDPETNRSATFTFTDEDHTLGNALHYVLMKNPKVEFSGYTVPHPSQPTMNVRIQTTGQPAVESMHQALTDLKSICSHVLTTFDEALETFDSQM